MHRTVLALASLLLIGTVVPGALAGWRSYVYDGNEEPSTKWDVASRMWQEPNQAAVDKIYFDTQIWVDGSGVPSPNPEGVTHRNYGESYFNAVLGYWRDCNFDGFIGDALTGAYNYPLELLEDDAICPVGSAYNDGTFAYEILFIGPEADDLDDGEVNGVTCTTLAVLCTRGQYNYIRDDAANVWQDWNLPTDAPAATRLLLPFPQGTLSDTNGHFQYVDSYTFGSLSGTGGPGCRAETPDGSVSLCWLWPSTQEKDDPDGPGGVRATAHANQCNSGDPVGGAVTALSAAPNGPDPADCPSGGTSPVPNAPDPVTAGVRDRINDSTQPGGTGPSGTAIVQPWQWCSDADASWHDCRGDRDESNDACVPRTDPNAWQLNPDGAISPTTDHIYRSVVPGVTEGDPCSNNPANSGNVVGNLEAAATPSDVAGKVENDSGFGFTTDIHFNPSETVGVPDVEVCVPDNAARFDFATRCGGQWFGTTQWIHSHGVTALNPAPLATYVATFYADVSFSDVFGGGDNARFNVEDPDGKALVSNDPATALPGGANNLHTYGEENCAVGRGTTSTGLWACSALEWIGFAGLDPAQPDDAESIYLLAKPGKGYDLRDVECYDNGVQGTSINAESGQSFACTGLVEPPFS